MVAAPVTKAEVATALANVPTLAPRPTFKNINAMEAAILDAVTASHRTRQRTTDIVEWWRVPKDTLS